jgi:hypothetical protein
MNPTTIGTPTLAWTLLLVCLTVSFNLVLRVAHDWYPFTPTFTSVEKKWMGWPDILRFGLSGVFLFILPLAYIGAALVHVSTNPAFYIPLALPSIREAIRILALFCLGLPILGFYDIWQAIVRSCPSLFYSSAAKQTIERRWSSAFTAQRIATLLIGVVWSFGPILFFYVAARL